MPDSQVDWVGGRGENNQCKVKVSTSLLKYLINLTWKLQKKNKIIHTLYVIINTNPIRRGSID